MKAEDVREVMVLGAGTMGHGIAQVAAMAGCRVQIRDLRREMVDKACGGNPEKLMMALLQYRGLSEEESSRIRKMLDEAKRQQ